MKHIRWYDKNPDLQQIFEFIQGLDESHQKKISQDMLQMLMCDFHLNLDEKINSISRDYNYDCKRWYDNNIDLFTSFEIIKSFTPELQREIINRTIKTILYIYLEEGNPLT